MSDEFHYNELEEILKKIRSEEPPEASSQADEMAELEPPKTREEMRAEAQPETEPEPELEWFTAEEAAQAESKKKEKKKTIPKPDAAVIKANFKTQLLPKAKGFFKKLMTRRFYIAVGAAVLLLLVILGAVKLYDYSKTAYLKPYIEMYGIEYPEGIREEFCDEYGRNQTTAGQLIIEDCGVDSIVNANEKNAVIMDKGSTVLENQHLRSITLKKSNLEAYYATAEDFINASQLVTFRTLFDDEEYKVVAAYYVNTDPDKDDGYVFPYTAYGNLTERSFKSYIDWVKTMSEFTTGEKLPYDGYYLSVNSPAAKQKDTRFVILCVRVDGDFEKTTSTKANKRTYKTQSWYDENGKENPFRFAAQWYPEIYTNDERTETKKLTAKDFK